MADILPPLLMLTLAAGSAAAAEQRFNCDFRSEVRIKSLSISAPMPEVLFAADKIIVAFDAGDAATITDAEKGAARSVRHVVTNGSEHFLDDSKPGQLTVLSVLQPDATGRRIAIWSTHAWGAVGADYARPSQRYGNCTAAT
jgi:hypothetical protein